MLLLCARAYVHLSVAVKAHTRVRKEIGREMIWIIAADSSWKLMAYNWIINCGADSSTASKSTAKLMWANRSSACSELTGSISSLDQHFLRQKSKACILAKAAENGCNAQRAVSAQLEGESSNFQRNRRNNTRNAKHGNKINVSPTPNHALWSAQ